MRTLLGRLLLFSLLITPSLLPAQLGARPRKKSPRAVAVLEFDAKGAGHLLPVSLFMDGKFYDAGLFMSRPAPLVLDTDTVYEAMRSGVGQGLFTVTTAGRAGKTWWANGKWKAYSADKIAGKPPAAEPEEKAKDEITIGDPEKPTLKRKDKNKSKGSETTTDASAAKDKPAPPKDDDDPDRPVMKRSKPDDEGTVKIQTDKDSKEATNLTPAKDDAPPPDDPERPLLHRGKPATQEPEKTGMETSLIVTHRPGVENFVAAVSDPDNVPTRPYSYVWLRKTCVAPLCCITSQCRRFRAPRPRIARRRSQNLRPRNPPRPSQRPPIKPTLNRPTPWSMR
jgi:hypothetical protein